MVGRCSSVLLTSWGFVRTLLLAAMMGMTFSGIYLKTKHWAMNNVFGIAFSIQVSHPLTP